LWLGAVSWHRINDALGRLPVQPGFLAKQWRELLATMQTDGDFRERKPRVAPQVADAMNGSTTIVTSSFRRSWQRSSAAREMVRAERRFALDAQWRCPRLWRVS
jgi:hypothetical protein